MWWADERPDGTPLSEVIDLYGRAETRVRRLTPPEGADLPTWHALHQAVLTIISEGAPFCSLERQAEGWRCAAPCADAGCVPALPAGAPTRCEWCDETGGHQNGCRHGLGPDEEPRYTSEEVEALVQQVAECEWLLRMTMDARDRAERQAEASEAEDA